MWLVFKPVGGKKKKTSKFIVCVFDCSLGKQINETTPIQWWLCIFFSLCVPEKKSWLLNDSLSIADKDYPNSSLCVLPVHQGQRLDSVPKCLTAQSLWDKFRSGYLQLAVKYWTFLEFSPQTVIKGSCLKWHDPKLYVLSRSGCWLWKCNRLQITGRPIQNVIGNVTF